jgi:hypothetical protein
LNAMSQLIANEQVVGEGLKTNGRDVVKLPECIGTRRAKGFDVFQGTALEPLEAMVGVIRDNQLVT